jgi:hypothetical protein
LVRISIVGVAICGAAACGIILPALGSNIAYQNPVHSHSYLPWLFFLWAASLPCFAILFIGWRIAAAIGREQVFTSQTARQISHCTMLLFGDIGFFMLGNVVLCLFGMSHPGVLLMSLFVCLFGPLLAVMCAVLSRYITKAAALQEEADGTI